MHQVPEHLRRDHDVPAEARAARPIDNWIFALNCPHKFQVIATYIALQMSRAVPAWGDSKKFYNPNLTHAELAKKSGVARSTFSSRMRHIRTIDTFEGDARRSPVMLSGPNKGKPREHYINVIGLIHSQPGNFMAPRKYSLAVPDGQKPEMRTRIQPGQYVPPNPDELLRLASIGEFFTPEARLKDPCRGKRKQIYTRAEVQFAGANGASYIPEWIWHENTPLSNVAKVVLTSYCAKGLLDPKNKGLLKDFRQTDCASMMGLSVPAVHAANQELERQGICRVFSEQVCVPGSKARRRTPQQVLYLPVRQFTEEESARELQRYRNALARTRQGAWGNGDEDQLTRLHSALINEWKGEEHCLAAFWNELRRRAKHWGMNQALIKAVVPNFLNKSSP